METIRPVALRKGPRAVVKMLEEAKVPDLENAKPENVTVRKQQIRTARKGKTPQKMAYQIPGHK